MVNSTDHNYLILLDPIFLYSVLFGQKHTNLNYQIAPGVYDLLKDPFVIRQLWAANTKRDRFYSIFVLI
jgi:hypothetical protein